MSGDRDPPHDRSAALRARLASVGIVLDEPVIDRDPKPSNLPASEPDRTAIRAYLEPLGAAEWMIASCPSLELARTYRPAKPQRRSYPPVTR